MQLEIELVSGNTQKNALLTYGVFHDRDIAIRNIILQNWVPNNFMMPKHNMDKTYIDNR